MSNMADEQARADWLAERPDIDPPDIEPDDMIGPLVRDPDPHHWPPFLWPENA